MNCPCDERRDGFWGRIADGTRISGAQYVSALEGNIKQPGRGKIIGFRQERGTHLVTQANRATNRFGNCFGVGRPFPLLRPALTRLLYRHLMPV